MLNFLWAGMILTAIIYSSFTGNLNVLGDSALESCGEAVSMVITLIGALGMWSGLMEIAKNCGILSKASKLLSPAVSFLFPDIPKESLAFKYISTNIIANMFGLGMAATPAGLKAINEMSKLYPGNIASNAMCTFLVINISSLQLIPVNIIAYRTQYGSITPSFVVLPAIIATSVSTLTAVIYCKIKCMKNT